ncbi:MAG TPA: hypothetical protein VFN67_38940 [Polyangiales bacterium]|nr:hypothetical protein [Polyangiales bacterium]
MTASKPPDKTLVGMPSDLRAVLEKLDRAAADKASIDQPHASTPVDTGKTHFSHGGSSDRPRSAPPPLPSHRPAAAPAAQLPGVPAQPHAGGAMDRTLIGMPAEDMQAALQRALAEVASPQPQTAPPRQLPKPQAAAAAPQQRPQPAAAEGVQALRAQPVRAIGIGGSPPPRASGLGHSGVPYGSGLGYQSGPRHEEPALKVLAPDAPLDWPPARRSDPGPESAGSPPAAAKAPPPSAAGSLHTVAAPAAPPPAASVPVLSLGVQTLDVGVDAMEATEQASRLALPLKTLDGRQQRPTKKTNDAPPKRWPAISLILVAVVAFGGVIVLRAPHLLPASLSNMLAPAPAVPDEMIAPEAATAPELPSAAAPVLATDTSAATDPAKATPTPTPTRPPAAPAMTSGASAQLEKKAIERLIANDFSNAKPLYEKLRNAEPTRGEFAVMVELLNRVSGAGCGQPGQPVCAGPRP